MPFITGLFICPTGLYTGMCNHFSSVAPLFPKFTFVYYRLNLKWNLNSFRIFLRGLEKDKLNDVAPFVAISTIFNMLTLPITWVHAVQLFSLSSFSCSYLLLHESHDIYNSQDKTFCILSTKPKVQSHREQTLHQNLPAHYYL